MSRIVVDLGWVADLLSDVNDTTSMLETSPNHAVAVPSAPILDGGTTSFLKRWDGRAGELAECLTSVGALLDAIHTGFSETDRALGDATASGGGGGGPAHAV